MSKVITVIRIIVNSGKNNVPTHKVVGTNEDGDMSYSKVSVYKNQI